MYSDKNAQAPATSKKPAAIQMIVRMLGASLVSTPITRRGSSTVRHGTAAENRVYSAHAPYSPGSCSATRASMRLRVCMFLFFM